MFSLYLLTHILHMNGGRTGITGGMARQVLRRNTPWDGPGRVTGLRPNVEGFQERRTMCVKTQLPGTAGCVADIVVRLV